MSSILLYPLDTLETRLQMDPRMAGKGVKQGIGEIKHREGWFGFYIGWEMGVFGIGCNWAMYYLIYDYMTSILKQNVLMTLLSGMIAGVLTSFVVNPFWVVKTQMIAAYSRELSKSRNKKITVKNVSSDVYQQQGWQGFYKGVWISACGCLQAAVQFLVYGELLKAIPVMYKQQNTVIFAAGAIANFFSVILTYPYLTIRSKAQASAGRDTSTLTLIAEMQKSGGFYSGLSSNLLRQVPTSGIMLTVAAFIKSILE